MLPEHASPEKKEQKAPTGVEVLPNIDVDAIAADCMAFKDEFLAKYSRIDDLLEQTQKHAPELYELLYTCVKPLEDFIKTDFDRFTVIAGRAARHGWDRGCADGERQGMLAMLGHLEDLTHTEIVKLYDEEDWKEFISKERTIIDQIYLQATGGMKVMWKFDEPEE